MSKPINWEVFRGDHTQNGDRIQQLPPPPPWRQFRKSPDDPPTPEQQIYQNKIADYWQQVQALMHLPAYNRDLQRGESFRIRTDQARVVQAVNAALALRRPLLITGRPGSGKTSLAYAIAHELKLGPVLTWSITARSTLEAGLYRYDAIARLQDAQLPQSDKTAKTGARNKTAKTGARNIGNYIQLGSLGTAFVPTPYPRVLLIDEIDKSDINLPNDLLNLLEEGEFEIPDLVRLADEQNAKEIQVRTADNLQVTIENGRLRCDAFPLIVMTSNGERDFPPAFLRRCLRVAMPQPIKADLYNIVEAHLTKEVADQVNDLIEHFLTKTDQEATALATDQLLNAVYLRKYGATVDSDSDLAKLILAVLTSSGGTL